MAFSLGIRFKTPDEQTEYIRNWLIQDANLPEAASKLNISYYTGRFFSIIFWFTIFLLYSNKHQISRRVPQHFSNGRYHIVNTWWASWCLRSRGAWTFELVCHLFALSFYIYSTVRFKAPFTAKTWMDKFNHVVGIIHTNYVMYSQSYSLGQLKGPLISFINQGICRAYCHKIIKLSAALQEFAAEKEVVCNVHGKIDFYSM